MDFKTCRTCKQLKPLDAFGKDKNREDSKNPRCHICYRIYMKPYFNLEKEQVKRLSRTKDQILADTLYDKTYAEKNKVKQAAQLADKLLKMSAQERQDYNSKRYLQQDVARKKLKMLDPKLFAAKNREHQSEYRNKNREKLALRYKAKLEAMSSEEREEYRARKKAIHNKRRDTNPELYLAQNLLRSHVRRARMREAGIVYMPPKNLITQMYKFYGKSCLKCGSIQQIEVDHIVPITKGGSCEFDNLQPLCKICNMKKFQQTIDYRTPFHLMALCPLVDSRVAA